MYNYEEIYQKWIKEWNSIKILSLTDDFCAKIGEYIKKSKAKKQYDEITPLEKNLFETKHERLDFLIKDYITLRMRKILKSIVDNVDIDFTNLTRIEDILYSNLGDAINTYFGIVFQENQTTKNDEIQSGRKIVRILEQLDSFVGTDLKIYGPFMPEDICILPNENVKALIDRDVALAVEIKKD